MDSFFRWEEKYSVQNEILDEQHKKLFEITNELYDAFVANDHKGKIACIIEELYDFSVYHFEQEEEQLKEKGYKIPPNHLQQHHDFIKKIADFQQKFYSEEREANYEMMNFLRSWLSDHIVVVEKDILSTKNPKQH